MKFSSNITLNVDTRQAGGGLQTARNWHLVFTEGVTKVHQSAAAEPILDCKSANELANPYSWVDATESVYFLTCGNKGMVDLASTMSGSPVWTPKPRLSHPNTWARSPDQLARCSPPPCNACSVVQDPPALVSNRPAWCLTWRKSQIFECPYLSVD